MINVTGLLSLVLSLTHPYVVCPYSGFTQRYGARCKYPHMPHGIDRSRPPRVVDSMYLSNSPINIQIFISCVLSYEVFQSSMYMDGRNDSVR